MSVEYTVVGSAGLIVGILWAIRTVLREIQLQLSIVVMYIQGEIPIISAAMKSHGIRPTGKVE